MYLFDLLVVIFIVFLFDVFCFWLLNLLYIVFIFCVDLFLIIVFFLILLWIEEESLDFVIVGWIMVFVLFFVVLGIFIVVIFCFDCIGFLVVVVIFFCGILILVFWKNNFIEVFLICVLENLNRVGWLRFILLFLVLFGIVIKLFFINEIWFFLMLLLYFEGKIILILFDVSGVFEDWKFGILNV